MKPLILFTIFILSTLSLPAQTSSGGSTWYGTQAGDQLSLLDTDARNNSFFGFQSGQALSVDDNNSFFGAQSGYNTAGSGLANHNSFFGSRAGYFNVSGGDNSFFGYKAGEDNTTSWNCFFGAYSGANNTSGNQNSFFGRNSGRVNTVGEGNTYVGYNTGQSATGSNNTFIGKSSGGNVALGSNNVFIGNNAGSSLTSGNDNVIIGSGATPTPLISSGISGLLMIDIEQTLTPLIAGSFYDNKVVINGEFEATGGVASSSDINVKDKIVAINETEILQKVSQLNISEWSYKTNLDVRHIGPMAQDFRAAFGLGANDTTISTIDTDGVALASIKALYNQLQEEREANKVMKRIIDDLAKRLEAIEKTNQ